MDEKTLAPEKFFDDKPGTNKPVLVPPRESVILEQNSTNSPLEILNFLNKIKRDPKEFLLYHQLLINRYFTEFPHSRGLLIYHEVGYGKTILASSLATYFAKQDKKIIVLAAKSLQDNFKAGVDKWQENMNTELSGKPKSSKVDPSTFKYVSLNANNLLDQLQHIDQTEATKKFEKSLGELNSFIRTKNAFNDCLLIIDEAHNLSNGVANGSKNAVGLYDMILKARNLKILLLTGTPIINDAFEIGILFNMVKGYIYNGRERGVLFPEIRPEFEQYFIDYKNMKIKNVGRFINRCFGLCSYYGTIYTDAVNKTTTDTKNTKNKRVTIKRQGFPLEYELKIELIPMSGEQFSKYDAAREREREESVGSRSDEYVRFSKKSGSTTYRIATRQISNYAIPMYALGDAIGKRARPKFINMIKDSDLRNLDKYSPKFKKILQNIDKHKGISVVYSEFVSGEGINLFARVLDTCGYEEWKLPTKGGSWRWKGDTPPDPNTYGIHGGDDVAGVHDYIIDNRSNSDDSINDSIDMMGANEDIYSWDSVSLGSMYSGGVDNTNNFVDDLMFYGGGKAKYVKLTGELDADDRTKILTYFNSSKNKNGELIKILLLSGAGSEGISIFNARSIHIMHPYWNMARINQVKARAIRYLSHESLPESERNVQPYIYLSTYPLGFEKDFEKNQDKRVKNGLKREILEKTTDIQLFHKSLRQQRLNDYFLAACIRASVDCSIHIKSLPLKEQKRINCIMCNPSNKRLYHPLISTQFKLDNPCIRYDKQKITVKEILLDLDGVKETYYYTDDDDIIIYLFDQNLDGYIEMDADHPAYSKLYSILEEKSKFSSVSSGQRPSDSPNSIYPEF